MRAQVAANIHLHQHNEMFASFFVLSNTKKHFKELQPQDVSNTAIPQRRCNHGLN